ncbi:SAM-dependent methyltransferase [Halostreptopolyspora alba]|uniref:SAM-dependent methyltransferase n=1 Tax=Halostreptopolyspora alba TaxID=2487137 RepID=UPI00269FFA50
MTDEGWAVPVDEAVGVPGQRVVRLDQHPGRATAATGEDGDPEESRIVHARQGFQRRVVDYLAADAGIRQFVDLGSLLPAGHGIQDIARSGAPDARTVYVDAWSAWSTRPVRGKERRDDAVPVVTADSMWPSRLIARLRECDLVDFGEPVAVLLLETAALRRDGVPPHELAEALYAQMCPGGHVAIALGPEDHRGDASPASAFGPFALLEPGLADVAWWPYPDDEVTVRGTDILAGVGRKR